jgi:hypothetical protein
MAQKSVNWLLKWGTHFFIFFFIGTTDPVGLGLPP